MQACWEYVLSFQASYKICYEVVSYPFPKVGYIQLGVLELCSGQPNINMRGFSRYLKHAFELCIGYSWFMLAIFLLYGCMLKASDMGAWAGDKLPR